MQVEKCDQENSKPFFSIIIPVYNVNLVFFTVCMGSIFQQSYREFEVILVDDGSKEECSKACDGYSRQDGRVRVIHQSNQGVSAARNHGIEAATADWIMFVDADDWLENNACELLKGYLEKTDCEILIFNLVKNFAKRQVTFNYGLRNETLYKTEDVNVREMLYSRTMGSPNTKTGELGNIYYSVDKVYSRNFLLNNHIKYPIGIPKSEDKVFILSCFERIHSLYYVDTKLYHYRVNGESVCNSYSENADKDRIVLIRLLKEIAERMDKEIGTLRHDSSYKGISKQLNLFVFGIISDVLKLKYYHPNYPRSIKECENEVKAFLQTEPFKSSLKNVKYSDLPFNTKIKKFMISHGLVSLFSRLKMIKRSFTGTKAQE